MHKQYWSRKKGRFVDKLTGEEMKFDRYCFSGRTREWYECFWESIIDILNATKTNECNIYAHPDACLMLESSFLFKSEPDYKDFLDPMYRGYSRYTEKNMKLYEVENQERNFIYIKDINNNLVGELEVLDM